MDDTEYTDSADEDTSNGDSSVHSEEERKDWEEEDTSPLVLYLLFFSVLSHDIEITRNLLESGVRPEWQLVFKLLEDTDAGMKHGIHTSKILKKRYIHYNKHRNPLSTKPNLLEMVCLSAEDDGRQDMLQLLLLYKTDISMDTLSSVVFNPVANRACWEKLAALSSQSRGGASRRVYLPCGKFTYTSLLVDIFMNRWQQSNTVQTKQYLFSVVKDILQWYTLESANQMMEWFYNLSFCMEKAVELKEPGLLELLLNKHRAVEEQASESGWSSFKYTGVSHIFSAKFVRALQHKAYYSLFLLIRAGLEYGRKTDCFPDSPLMYAIMEKDLFAVVMILQCFDKSLTWPCQIDSATMTMAAGCEKDNEILILWWLCAQGGDVNSFDSITGETLLFKLVRRKRLLGVELLLRYNADVNYYSESGAPPLFMAVVNHSLEILRILLRANADTEIVYVDRRTFTRQTAASYALYHRHYDTLQILLAVGAEVPPKCRALFGPFSEDDVDSGPYEEAKRWIKEFVQAPASLKIQCRRFIRTHIGGRIDLKMKEFDYPVFLKEYLTTERIF